MDLRQPLGGALLPPGQTYLVSHEWGDPYRQFGALLFLGVFAAHVVADRA